MKTSDIWAVVPAAGIGRRLAADRPKQYLTLGARPVVGHVISKLAAVREVAGIVAAVASADPWWDEVAKGFDAPVVRVVGGAERCDSVANALDYLSTVAADDDLVMVHDAVRPCVAVTDIERVVATARHQPHGALLAAPVWDTLKRVGPDGSVADTLDRSRLWRAYTPQVFRLRPLRAALAKAIADGVPVTDEAQAMERAGARPHLVEGSPGNIKITHPEDLPLARALLAAEGTAS